MGKHEIRLRRQRPTNSGSDRFRNFNTVMQRHERTMRLREIIRVVTIFAVIMTLVMVVIIMIRFGKNQNEKKPVNSTSYVVEKPGAQLKSV